MTRSLVRPLTRSLTRSLVRGPSLDPDAAAYIDALVSGGATVTSEQSSAIDTFIRAEKAGERWDLIKRLYLPIWELAAPNAICMRSLTSGTFVGGVTHGAGFVQGDGSTGYFDIGASSVGLGLTVSSSYYAALGRNTFVSNQSILRARDASANDNGLGRISDGRLFTTFGVAADLIAINTATSGIISASRQSSSDGRFLARRNTSGRSLLVSDSVAPTGSLPSINLFGMGANISGSISFASSNQFGNFTVGLKFTDSQDFAFTANLKTLWETATGLSLPA